MPTQPGSFPSDVSIAETIQSFDAARDSLPLKRDWETPSLEMIALDETESGAFFATAELTSPLNAQPLPS